MLVTIDLAAGLFMMQALGLQCNAWNCELKIQEDAGFLSISKGLTVPVHILVSRFRNKREVELVMDVSNSAAKFQSLLENYETISIRAQALQESWDGLWVSQEPQLVAAISVIGEKISGMNRVRAVLLKKIYATLEHLQVLGKSLVQYAEINSSIAEELKMEGIERLATDKLFVADLEQELAKRVNMFCTKGSIENLSPMLDFINSLTQTPELIEPAHEETAPDHCCNTLNKISRPHQGIDLNKLDSLQNHEQSMENIGGFTHTSQLQVVHSVSLLQQNIQPNDICQSDKALEVPATHRISSMGASCTSETSAQDGIPLIVPNNSASASEEQGAELVSEKQLGSSHTAFPHQGKRCDIGSKQVHLGTQSVCNADKNGMKWLSEACEIAGNNSSAGSKIWASSSPSSFPNGCEEGQSDDSFSSHVKEYHANPVLMTQAITQGQYTDPDLMAQAVAEGQYVSCVHDNAKGSEIHGRSSELCSMRDVNSKQTPALVGKPNGYGNVIGMLSSSCVGSGTGLKSIDSQFCGDPKDSNTTDALRMVEIKDMLPSLRKETKWSGVGCLNCTTSRDGALKMSLNSSTSPCDPPKK